MGVAKHILREAMKDILVNKTIQRKNNKGFLYPQNKFNIKL